MDQSDEGEKDDHVVAHQEHLSKRSKRKDVESCQIKSWGLGHEGRVVDQWL